MTNIFAALMPVILLLGLGISTAIASRACRLSPIIGYILLGFALKAGGVRLISDNGTVALLAELGVVFLLFDIGLHLSPAHIRQQVGDIFGLGPLQLLLGAGMLGSLAWLAGLPPLPAYLLGVLLAMSSTAVVAQFIIEGHQQNCPVGLTATAILIFQDLAAIVVLVLVGALGEAAHGPAAVLSLVCVAFLKAGVSFAIALALARFVVRPLFAVIAGQQHEVFTATALLITLTAGWATGHIGLSPTLGAFLGGMTVAETPYRALVQAELNPFRGLLLGFFFISVGLSLNVSVLASDWPLVIAMTAVIVGSKVLSNFVASLIFRWSVPGSLHLGFLLSQGSEFTFLVFSLPTMRLLIGSTWISIVSSAVVLSLAATPTLARAGRIIAGRLRLRDGHPHLHESLARALQPPVIIIGMDRVGRTLADALHAFDISYSAVEADQRLLSQAVADGYNAVFGDMGDPRLWDPVAMHGRRISALTVASYEVTKNLLPIMRRRYPGVRHYVMVADATEAGRFHTLGMHAVISKDAPGLNFTLEILNELGIARVEIEAWIDRQQRRISSPAAIN
ncbi:MAG TPA: cation:proton antiporter [Acidiphilium sp.]|nr:cation:proton antiporter [Acidiphilium sp.]